MQIEKDGGELKLPPGSTVKLSKDGQPILEVKGDRRATREVEQEKLEKELLATWSAVAGQPEVLKHIFVYKRLEGTDGQGNNETLMLTLPLNQFIDESGKLLMDLEGYLKDRLGKGNYVCRIKVNHKIAKNITPYIYTFIEDGKIWKKGKMEEEDDEGDDIGVRGRFKRMKSPTSEIAQSVENAVRLGMESKSDDLEGQSGIVRALTDAIIKKEENKSPDATMPILLEIIKSAMQPRGSDSSIEVMRIISDSVKDLGRNMSDAVKEMSKTLAETNNKMNEMQIRAIEERSKDKIEILKVIQGIKEGSGGNNMETVNKMIAPLFDNFKLMSGIQAQTMEGVVRMVKGAVEMATDLKHLGEEPEGKETIGEKLLEGVLNVGSKVVDGIFNKQQGNISLPSIQEEVIKKQKSEEEIEVDEDKQFINEIIKDMLDGIEDTLKPDNETIIGEILDLDSDRNDKIKELMGREQAEIEKLIVSANKIKILANFQRMKELMELLKVKLDEGRKNKNEH